MALLRVSDLVVVRGGRRAVAGARFEVAAGECLGVAGPNAAGKSTLLDAIAGVCPIASGTVEVEGVAARPGRQAADIGYAAQEPVFYPKLTGRENLELFGTLHGLETAALRDRIRELVADLDLEEWIDAPAGGYSGGIARRLHLALAIVQEPRLLLLDEPTAGLDPASRHAVLRTVTRLAAGGTAVVITSQILNDLELVAARVLVLIDGRQAVLDSTGAVLEGMGSAVIAVECLRHPDRELDLEGLPGVLGWAFEDGVLRARVASSEVLPELLTSLRRQGLQPTRVEVQPPTFERFVGVVGVAP